MELNKEYWIEKLALQKHPEGGYYRETYRSVDKVNLEGEVNHYDSSRNASTAIYYLLSGEEFSAFHQLKSDEIFHFYHGSSLTVHIIDLDGNYSLFSLGNNPENNEVLQLVIPHGSWFASHVSQPNSYSLIGCTVSPGFDFGDFTLAKREELRQLYSQHEDLINRWTIC